MKKNTNKILPMPPLPSPRIKVGDVKKNVSVVEKKTGSIKKQPVFYSYKDVYYDIDGWADAKGYLPDDFDIVFLKLKRNKTIPGWINRYTWEGYRLKPDDEVLFWKRKEDPEEKCPC